MSDKGAPLASPSSCSSVRHQILCVEVCTETRTITGHTVLQVVPPSAGELRALGFSSHGLEISRVTVDGVEADFEIRSNAPSPSSTVKKGNRTARHVAELAQQDYLAALEAEALPDLVVKLPDPQSTFGASHEPPSTATTPQQVGPTLDEKVQLLSVRVDYFVRDPQAGVRFRGHTMVSQSQRHRARCWFPCADAPSHRCSFEVCVTVKAGFLVISSGSLISQDSREDGRDVFTYALPVPVAAEHLALLVGRVESTADANRPVLIYASPATSMPALQQTMAAFHTVFSLFEEYLGAPFPFKNYTHVLVDAEMAISSCQAAASMTVMSSHLLVDERMMDQAGATLVKLAQALAYQWFGIFITPDMPADEWLLEGLAGHLTQLSIRCCLGASEAAYHRFKSNEAVCLADSEAGPVLSAPSSRIGAGCAAGSPLGPLAKLRAQKALAVVEMLEKQMGSDAFRKVLQRIILKAQDSVRRSRTLSTREFRHFANKLGNLEKPFLKDFFPRWVASAGCPSLRLGFSSGRRRTAVELVVQRSQSDAGWPGMMTVRVHEGEGPFDHTCVPLGGDPLLLLELPLHSKVPVRRTTGVKRGAGRLDTTPEEDGLQDPGGGAAEPGVTLEMALQWVVADPEHEYLAQLHVQQPASMWMAQLERERGVGAQLQAIAALRKCTMSSAANALQGCLANPRIFWRVRREAATALADGGGGHLLIQHLHARCFDQATHLPRPNDFRNTAEYLVNQSVVGAVAAIRGSDGFSLPEAGEAVLEMLRHNDNSRNALCDDMWRAALLEAAGTLRLSPQRSKLQQGLLRQLDRYLQYERLVPSYKGVVASACARALANIALQSCHSGAIMSGVEALLQLMARGDSGAGTRIRLAALSSLLALELAQRGMAATVCLAISWLHRETSLAVQRRLVQCVSTMAANSTGAEEEPVGDESLDALHELLLSPMAFRNTGLRYAIFTLLQALAGRSGIAGLVGDNGSRSEKPLTVRIPRASATAGGSTAPRIEPLRIKRGPSGLSLSCDALPSASNGSIGSGAGHHRDEARVGVVKLRLRGDK